MKNILTVDIEDWYHANALNISVDQYEHCQDRIEQSTLLLLGLLEKHDLKATFFILGCVAGKHPGLIKKIVENGHEIGSHGYWHKLVYEQKPEEFRKELLHSKSLLEDITGRPVKFYRAPSWSITRKCLWALIILEEEGFTCSSSIYPFRNPLYGISKAPGGPYYPVVDGKTLNILEYPPTVFQIWNYRFPFAGGLYLRLLPGWLIIKMLASVNKQKPAMVYTHPWETDIKQPRLKVPALIKFVHYHNLETTVRKLEALFKRFKFTTLGEAIKGKKYPVLPL
ncbi:MAG: DUF3473 domain-containing protein [Peptococcaceae bacterium]|nr:DUF3473 domain-containing protein [Peptococcaceae bacterium]MDH7523977.1 DUF3473 domain-containing protein [Peptococcaceae bacterium]